MKFNVLFRASGRINPISAHQPYFTRIIENGVPDCGGLSIYSSMQCRKDKKKLNELCHSEKFRNLDPETAKMIAIHIDRKRLMYEVEKEGVLLCQAFDELMEDKRLEGIQEGIERGIREGTKEGERKGRLSIIRHLLEAGMEESQIVRVAQCSEEEILLAMRR